MKKVLYMFIVEISFMEIKMELGHKYGMIRQNMRENGKIINLMDMEYIIFLMEKSMLGNGKIVVKMDLEYFTLMMVENMLDFIKRIKEKDLEYFI